MNSPAATSGGIETPSTISVFLADDNIIVREGVRAMLARNADIEIVGTADDYDSLVKGAGSSGSVTTTRHS